MYLVTSSFGQLVRFLLIEERIRLNYSQGRTRLGSSLTSSLHPLLLSIICKTLLHNYCIHLGAVDLTLVRSSE